MQSQRDFVGSGARKQAQADGCGMRLASMRMDLGGVMFIIVCASTPRSSIRVGCAGPREAQIKMAELEAAAIGKVRAFDGSGKRITPEDLAAMMEASPLAPLSGDPTVA